MRERDPREGLLPGIALLVIGTAVLLSRYSIFAGPGAIVLGLGVLFLLVSAARGFSGPLLPGGILTGLGAALLLKDRLEPRLPEWGTILLGLSAGFLFVAAVDAAKGRSRRPSPLLPGVVLGALGILSVLRRSPAFRWIDVDLRDVWPWLAVAVGLFLVARAFFRDAVLASGRPRSRTRSRRTGSRAIARKQHATGSDSGWRRRSSTGITTKEIARAATKPRTGTRRRSASPRPRRPEARRPVVTNRTAKAISISRHTDRSTSAMSAPATSRDGSARKTAGATAAVKTTGAAKASASAAKWRTKRALLRRRTRSRPGGRGRRRPPDRGRPRPRGGPFPRSRASSR